MRDNSGSSFIPISPIKYEIKKMKVLVTDDDKNLNWILVQELSKEGITAHGANDGAEALDCLKKEEWDVLVLDLNMPGMGGLDVIKRIKENEISVEVIVLTGNATVSNAVEAMKLGASDFMVKPVNITELSLVIGKAFERKEILSENRVLKEQAKRIARPDEIITVSAKMRDLLENARKTAMTDFPVLVLGESGTGKELVAKSIHADSPRRDRPFVPINCGAIPENMLESELFGYEKGAFTGAGTKKMGLLEVATGGTLFLDEIGEMPMMLQTKLLRAIESNAFFRLGATMETRVNVRVVAATNKDLKAEIKNGKFREDLYYRISTITLFIPPLRERKEDIPLLAARFKDAYPEFKEKSIGPEVMNALTSYSWPGNVRELQNVVYRMLLLARGTVTAPTELTCEAPHVFPSQATLGHKSLEAVEKEYILSVLNETGGQKKMAAEILGVDVKTLYRKLASYGIK